MAGLVLLLPVWLTIHLNTAPPESLRLLPIGYEDAVSLAAREGRAVEEVLRTERIPETKVQRIIEYRILHGPFRTVYDLFRIPGITSGDVARWKDHLVVEPPAQRGMVRDVERIRSFGALEESPRASAFDYWLYRLRAPLWIQKATVEDLQSLPGVSLLDAVAAVRYARKASLYRVSHLRRAPELSSYGYFNLRPFVTIREPRLPEMYGWASVSLYLPNEVVYSTDYLYERLQELDVRAADTTTRNRLQAAGWTDAQVDSLYARLSRYRQDEARITTRPWFRFKSVVNHRKGLRTGLAFHQSPFYLEGPLVRGFVDYASSGMVERLLLGHFRIALDQGVMMDNAEESRDRLVDRDQGIFGDLTASRTMGFLGGYIRLGYGRLHLSAYGASNRRPVLLDRNGAPLFLYTGSFIPTELWDRGVRERVVGSFLDLDLPRPFLVGSRLRFHVLDIAYDRPLSMRFEDLDFSLDREDLAYDGSFPEGPVDGFRLVGLAFQTVKFPVSLEMEVAHQLRGGSGNALAVAVRVQKPRFFWNLHYRRQDPGFFNPYQRSFQEDSRFEDTPLERPYRLVDPLASSLRDFPAPKPEEGFFLETRYQLNRKWLIPRFYVDVWRDRTDGLWNYRINVEGEFRPVHAVRFRYRERFQKRRNLRGVAYTESFSEERALRVFYLLQRGIAGVEIRQSTVDLTPRVDLPRAGMKGGFVSLFLRYDLTPQTQVQAGTAVWTNEGGSQWIFEDTGIDFLYGDGTKFYITLTHALTPRLISRLKLRVKDTRYLHNVHLEDGLQDVWGRPVEGSFVNTEPAWSISWTLDHFF